MLYRNTPRFQALLQRALAVAAKEKNFSDQKLVEAAQLTCGKSTLHRFRRADLGVNLQDPNSDRVDQPIERGNGVFLNRCHAKLLWDYLDEKRFVERAIAELEGDKKGFQFHKQSLYSTRELANAASCFYGTHRSALERFEAFGLRGIFLCYKPSFRRAGFVVKSKMLFKLMNHEYFVVHETQRSSGIFEIDRSGVSEKSEGFGFIKSDRLWLLLRDIETEQPRIYCFSEPKYAESPDKLQDSSPKNNRLTMFFGHLIEGAKKNAKQPAYSFNVVMVSEEADRTLWREEFQNESYVLDEQIDIYPTAREQLQRYKDRKKFCIPDELVEYLGESGRRHFNEVP
jgi:hypothetical protein